MAPPVPVGIGAPTTTSGTLLAPLARLLHCAPAPGDPEHAAALPDATMLSLPAVSATPPPAAAASLLMLSAGGATSLLVGLSAFPSPAVEPSAITEASPGTLLSLPQPIVPSTPKPSKVSASLFIRFSWK